MMKIFIEVIENYQYYMIFINWILLYISLNNFTFIKYINNDVNESKHLFILSIINDIHYNLGFYAKYKGCNNSDSYTNINNRNIQSKNNKERFILMINKSINYGKSLILIKVLFSYFSLCFLTLYQFLLKIIIFYHNLF